MTGAALLFMGCTKGGLTASSEPHQPLRPAPDSTGLSEEQPVVPAADAGAAEEVPDIEPVACELESPDLEELHRQLTEQGADCAALLGVAATEAPHGCDARLLGNGSTLFIYAEVECGGDSCSGNTWVWNARTCGPLSLRDSLGTFEAAPDGSFLLVDDGVESSEPTPTGYTVDYRLLRVNLPSLSREAFAPCMSAALSPGGGWILCRNRQADVLKVPLSGGEPEMVVQVGSKSARWVPYALIYPSAVEFSSPTRMVYTVAEEGADAVQKVTVEWEE